MDNILIFLMFMIECRNIIWICGKNTHSQLKYLNQFPSVDYSLRYSWRSDTMKQNLKVSMHQALYTKIDEDSKGTEGRRRRSWPTKHYQQAKFAKGKAIQWHLSHICKDPYSIEGHILSFWEDIFLEGHNSAL